MFWRAWCFLVGLPLGPLALLALPGGAAEASLRIAAVVGAVVLVGAVSWIGRLRDDDPARGLHLANMAGVAGVAWPALALERLALAPGAAASLAVVVVLLGLALRRGAWAHGPCPPWRIPLTAVVAPLLVGAALLALSAAIAELGAPAPRPGGTLASAVYEFDARVATRARPDCAQRVASSRVLIERGAHPRWSSDRRWSSNGERIWFDAPDETGRRQIHRLDLATARVRCWTCGQPGNNARPAPAPGGALVVYDSDRHADASAPTNTELYWITAAADEPPAAGRRLTFARGPDDHAVLGPSARVLAWSRGEGGRYRVASASVLQGHGGVVLQEPGVLVAGGAAWTAPLAWSRDARTLVAVRGNPFRPLNAFAVDPATGEERALRPSRAQAAVDVAATPTNGGSGEPPNGGATVPAGSVAAELSADGGWVLLLGAERRRAAGLLPDGLGFLLGSFATRSGLTRALFRDVELASGPAEGAPRSVAVDASTPELAGWGAATGVALGPDGRRAVIGLRRDDGTGAVRERLVELTLACAEPDG